MPESNEQILSRVRDHAFRRLSAQKRRVTNLYIDRRVYEKGEPLGPKIQKISLAESSIVVFADDDPLANFAHQCRYLLYEPKGGSFVREVPARFPPFPDKPPRTLEAFHQPIVVLPNPHLYKIWPFHFCPVIRPDGARYAILYSGMSDNRHLNDLEFCYRMLVDRYGFEKSNIYVLNYDGTLNTKDYGGPPATWPGDGTAYRIKVTGKGNRAAFQAAFNDLKTKVKSHDLLFIHTNNHGDNDGVQSYLCAYPSWDTYYANDFCTDLKVLPAYRSLIVMMEQCNAGGFNAPILAASTATNTSVASAAVATASSYASPDGNWDSFARDWIAGEMGADPYGAALDHNADTNNDGVIEAEEAFDYAVSIQYPGDSPNFSESSEAGGDITLGQRYKLWWWWCWIVFPILERYVEKFPPPPGPEMYEKIQGITLELQKQLIPALDRAAADVQKEVVPKVEQVIKSAFERR